MRTMLVTENPSPPVAPGYAAQSAENGLQAMSLRESERPCACSS